MDFRLTVEQELLKRTAAEVAKENFGAAAAQKFVSDGVRGPLPEAWSTLVGLGLTGLLVPERLGGTGGGLLEACLVAESLAADLAPLPFVSGAIASPAVLSAFPGAQSDELLSEVAAGRVLSPVLDSEMNWPPRADAAVAWEWTSASTALTFDAGNPALLYSVSAEVDCVDLLHPIAMVRPHSIDPLTPMSSAVLRARAQSRVGLAAALYGTARGAAQMAFDYVQTREQYGKVIGSFQVIQHSCADLVVDLESSRSVCYGAAWKVENSSAEDGDRIAAIAKSWCADAAIRCAETVTQLLGGIGVTWESAAHLYLRQAHLYATLLGNRRTLALELGKSLVERDMIGLV